MINVEMAGQVTWRHARDMAAMVIAWATCSGMLLECRQ